MNVEIKLKEEVIKQIMVDKSVKTLGVCLNPMIEWKDQYEHVKKKIQITIRKLMRTDVKVHQECMHFKMCMLTNVFWMRSSKF